MDFLKPYFWRLLFTLIGLVTSISFLAFGFWKTVLVVLCCGIGHIAGMYKDKIIRSPEWFWRDR